METDEAAASFAALSQGTRLDLIRLLIAQGPTGLAAGKIASCLGIPSPTLSFHLNALERARLTQSTRQGRQIIHAVRIEGVRQLLRFLTQTCYAGRPELCGDLADPVLWETTRVGGVTAAFNVLFVCTHNSARSIMAEAILTEIGGARFRAYSAGSDPIMEPNPEVIARLRVFGHNTDHFRSKSWHEFTGRNAPRMDFVITLCEILEGQTCPDFGNLPVTAAWPMPDPLKFTGGVGERTSMLNMLYASLLRRLENFIALPFAELDGMAMRTRLDELADGGLPIQTRGH